MKEYKLLKDYDTPCYFAPKGSLITYGTLGYATTGTSIDLNKPAMISFSEAVIKRALGVWFEEVKSGIQILDFSYQQDYSRDRSPRKFFYRFQISDKIPDEKITKVISAIEGLLNKEKTLYEEDDMIEFAKQVCNKLRGIINHPVTSGPLVLFKELELYKNKKGQCG